jgi:type I restriction enzyme S subunit
MKAAVEDTGQKSWLYKPEFPASWAKRQLYDLARWTNGMAFRDFHFTGRGRPIIKIAEIKEGISGQTNFTETEYDPAYFVRSGDMLFAWSGQPETSLDVYWWRGTEGWLNQHIFKVEPRKECDRVFFFYLLRYLKPNFIGIARNKQTTGLGHVTKRDLEAMEVAVPPLSEQRAIAGVLGALDDKIELNRRMNETLEALAQAEFGRMKEEGKGRKGWREDNLDNIATYLNGLALQKFPPDGDDSLPVIKIAQLRAGNTEGADRASAKIPAVYIVEDGDVLFSWSGSLEVVLWCGGRGALNQHLFKVTSANYPKWFYYLWTKHHLPDFQAIAAGKATTMGHIQRHHLSEAEVLIPPAGELKAMDAKMSPLIEKIIANNVESRTLAALRDALLPKLINGQLRIKN